MEQNQTFTSAISSQQGEKHDDILYTVKQLTPKLHRLQHVYKREFVEGLRRVYVLQGYRDTLLSRLIAESHELEGLSKSQSLDDYTKIQLDEVLKSVRELEKDFNAACNQD